MGVNGYEWAQLLKPMSGQTDIEQPYVDFLVGYA
uniref:Uncharacterized protein n=1 Tax=uncultured nuHF1 cluster bacterium HF0770_35I22 TaxID=723586 RepID=E7C7M1_9BACT|nr:hypothetical protein [uncultured nuHF1 cluster bacterium HF0770_35I22]